jgi:hypothetical protein
MTTELRCYAKQEGTQWIAVCIDLGLAAQADSLDHAKRKLESMINTYIQEALTIHREYANQLLSRKAPLSQQLAYYGIKLRHNLGRLFHRQNSAILFTEIMSVRMA